jgi:hypothetical protein
MKRRCECRIGGVQHSSQPCNEGSCGFGESREFSRLGACYSAASLMAPPRCQAGMQKGGASSPAFNPACNSKCLIYLTARDAKSWYINSRMSCADGSGRGAAEEVVAEHNGPAAQPERRTFPSHCLVAAELRTAI